MSAGDLDATALDWLSLEDDEELVWASGPDRRTLVPVFIIGIPLSIVLIGLVIIASEYLRVSNTHYVLTNQALYRKTGVFSRDVKRIEHGKVQDISYSQSAVGNYFGYGTVEVSTAGGSGVELSFKSVADPRSVQRQISDLVDRGQRDTDEDRPIDDIMGDILAELRAIRNAVEASDTDRRQTDSDAQGRVGRGQTETTDRGQTETGRQDQTETKAQEQAGRTRSEPDDHHSPR